MKPEANSPALRMIEEICREHKENPQPPKPEGYDFLEGIPEKK